MKEHNQLSYASRFQRGVKLAIGLDEEMGGVGRLSESLQVVIDPRRYPEWAAPMGERLCWASLEQPAVALQFAGVGIRNPAGSRVIAVVEGFQHQSIDGGTVEFFQRATSAVGVTAVATGFGRDSRFGFEGNGTALRTLTGSNAAIASFGSGPVWVYRSAGANVADMQPLPPVVITPGFDFWAAWNLVSQEFRASYAWRELRMMPGTEQIT